MPSHTAGIALVTIASALTIGAATGVHAQAVTFDQDDLRALRDCQQPGGEDPSGSVLVFHTSLMLVGMSPSGALATLQYRDDDVLPSWVLEIVSLVTDEVVVQRRWDDPDGEMQLDDLVATHGSEILADLAGHHIGPDALALEPFPLASHAGSFDLEVLDRELFLVAPNRARKRITTVATAGTEVVPDVRGRVSSPHERRVAVVIRTYEPGFEGTSNARYQLVGAHLDTGFEEAPEQMQPTPRVKGFVKSLEEVGFFVEDGDPRRGDPADTMMARFVPEAFEGVTARFGYRLKKRESLGGGLHPDVDIEEWQFASVSQARAAHEALTTAQDTQSDTGPMWKMPHAFAIEGRYVYRVWTRAHAFIPDWKVVFGRLQAGLQAGLDASREP
jgi:hypothetical protein